MARVEGRCNRCGTEYTDLGGLARKCSGGPLVCPQCAGEVVRTEPEARPTRVESRGKRYPPTRPIYKFRSVVPKRLPSSDVYWAWLIIGILTEIVNTVWMSSFGLIHPCFTQKILAALVNLLVVVIAKLTIRSEAFNETLVPMVTGFAVANIAMAAGFLALGIYL